MALKVKLFTSKSRRIRGAIPKTATQKGYKVVDKRMSHAAPEWIQGKGEGGFLILDDYTRKIKK